MILKISFKHLVPQLRNLLANRNEKIFELSNSILDKIKGSLINELFNQQLNQDYLKEEIAFINIKELKKDIDIKINLNKSLECKDKIISMNNLKNKLKNNSLKEMESSSLTLKKKRKLSVEDESSAVDKHKEQKDRVQYLFKTTSRKY